jgi:hypothetical protein
LDSWPSGLGSACRACASPTGSASARNKQPLRVRAPTVTPGAPGMEAARGGAGSTGYLPRHDLRHPPEDIDRILEQLATMAAGYDNHLKWNEEAQLKADLMHNRRYWQGFDVALVRSRCQQLEMRPEDARLVSDLVSKAQAGRRLIPQRSYRDYRFRHDRPAAPPSPPSASERRTSREW